MNKPNFAIASLFGSLLALAFLGVGLTFDSTRADAREHHASTLQQGNVGGSAGTNVGGNAGTNVGGGTGTGGSVGGTGGSRP